MIITVIKDIVENGLALGFYHGNEDWQNLQADEQSFPAVYLDQPITNDYELSPTGYIGAEYPIKLLFCYKSEMDYTTTQHEDNCITPADTKIREFISRCQAHESVSEVSEASAIEFTNLFDVNCSGKILSIKLGLNNTDSVCV